MIPSYPGIKIKVPAEQVFRKSRAQNPTPDPRPTSSLNRDTNKGTHPIPMPKPTYVRAFSRVVPGSGTNPGNKNIGHNAGQSSRSTDKGKIPIYADGFTLVNNKRGTSRAKGRSFSLGYTSYNVYDALLHARNHATPIGDNDGTLKVVMVEEPMRW